MKITDAGLGVFGLSGSRISLIEIPLPTNNFIQLSMVRKYQGAGSATFKARVRALARIRVPSVVIR